MKYPLTDDWYFSPVLQFSTTEGLTQQAASENELVAHKHPHIFTFHKIFKHFTLKKKKQTTKTTTETNKKIQPKNPKTFTT